MRFFGHLVVQIASKHPYCRIRINVHVKTVPTMYITWGLRKKKFFRNLNLNANPERWNQRCFLFIQSVINAKCKNGLTCGCSYAQKGRGCGPAIHCTKTFFFSNPKLYTSMEPSIFAFCIDDTLYK